ncbi:MAG: DUF2857 family protein [Gammaproteobacteria bacterium]|nr:DUF2857 family protein [Gammaproteobacteria bacterium]MCP5135441.1 DUF2857 family protein [Gammaproteobacteria bacterium]
MNAITNEGLLAKAVLDYLQGLVNNGSVTTLRDLGIDEAMRLDIAEGLDPETILSARAVVVNVLNVQSLQDLVRRARDAKRGRSIEDALLKAEAPRSLMEFLFGWSEHQYQRRRNRLALPPLVGRPPHLGAVDEALVEDAWDNLEQTRGIRRDDEDKTRLAHGYLAVARLTGISLRAIFHDAKENAA